MRNNGPVTSSPRPSDDIDAHELGRRSHATLRVGLLMLGSGTASYRVKQGMKTVAKALGVDEHSEQVTLMEITTTSRVGQQFRTAVSELRHNSVNADRIARLDRFRRNLPSAVSPADVHRGLDESERHGQMYNPGLNSSFAGAACAGFALGSDPDATSRGRGGIHRGIHGPVGAARTRAPPIQCLRHRVGGRLDRHERLHRVACAHVLGRQWPRDPRLRLYPVSYTHLTL